MGRKHFGEIRTAVQGAGDVKKQTSHGGASAFQKEAVALMQECRASLGSLFHCVTLGRSPSRS